MNFLEATEKQDLEVTFGRLFEISEAIKKGISLKTLVATESLALPTAERLMDRLATSLPTHVPQPGYHTVLPFPFFHHYYFSILLFFSASQFLGGIQVPFNKHLHLHSPSHSPHRQISAYCSLHPPRFCGPFCSREADDQWVPSPRSQGEKWRLRRRC